jgi:6-phosphofructokinase 1
MSFQSEETDQYGHKKLGGIGDKVSAALKELSPKFNDGRQIEIINQRLGHLVRSGDPDALDSIVPMAFGNIAFDLVLGGSCGRLVSLRSGVYDSVPLDVVTGQKRKVNVHKFYDTERLRPKYTAFVGNPVFIMSGA